MDKAQLVEIANTEMPFGKYKGRRLIDVPEVLWSSFFGHADQMVGLCTGGQLGGRAGQRFVLCG
ncbi:DUF3820 family protein [Klebsiella pneumoniae]|uniref:putative quorum-sensing-regulated virulence factor n=1 Tax=Klebsiella pneumoniae TaxID=573 RepID=UPI0031BA45A7